MQRVNGTCVDGLGEIELTVLQFHRADEEIKIARLLLYQSHCMPLTFASNLRAASRWIVLARTRDRLSEHPV